MVSEAAYRDLALVSDPASGCLSVFHVRQWFPDQPHADAAADKARIVAAARAADWLPRRLVVEGDDTFVELCRGGV